MGLHASATVFPSGSPRRPPQKPPQPPNPSPARTINSPNAAAPANVPVAPAGFAAAQSASLSGVLLPMVTLCPCLRKPLASVLAHIARSENSDPHAHLLSPKASTSIDAGHGDFDADYPRFAALPLPTAYPSPPRRSSCALAILFHAQLPSRVQRPGERVLIGKCQPDMRNAHPSQPPCTGRKRSGRSPMKAACCSRLIIGCRTPPLPRQRREDPAFDTKVCRAHVGALFRALKAERDAAKIVCGSFGASAEVVWRTFGASVYRRRSTIDFAPVANAKQLNTNQLVFNAGD